MLTAVMAAWALAPPRPLKVRTRRNSIMAACKLQADAAAPLVMLARLQAAVVAVVQAVSSESGLPENQAAVVARGCVFALRSFDPNYKKKG